MFVEVNPPTDKEFGLYQKMIQENIGVFLPPHKKPLLHNRLAHRLRERNCRDFRSYFELINVGSEVREKQLALELITTNETYFFREPLHFQFLQDIVLQDIVLPKLAAKQRINIWSAAASSGEEAYSIAMVLSEFCEQPWNILASDINATVLEKARKGIYLDFRTSGIPYEMKCKYCRRGVDSYSGHIRIVPELRQKIHYQAINLTKPIQMSEIFDIIFMRNVMIYFEKETQQKVLRNVLQYLKPGGYLFVGHAESLHGMVQGLSMVQPSVYRLDR